MGKDKERHILQLEIEEASLAAVFLDIRLRFKRGEWVAAAITTIDPPIVVNGVIDKTTIKVSSERGKVNASVWHLCIDEYDRRFLAADGQCFDTEGEANTYLLELKDL